MGTGFHGGFGNTQGAKENQTPVNSPSDVRYSKMKELDIVKLTKEFNGISCGTEGTIVLEYDGTHFEVEFFTSDGDTIDVLTTPSDVLELVSPFKKA